MSLPGGRLLRILELLPPPPATTSTEGVLNSCEAQPILSSITNVDVDAGSIPPIPGRASERNHLRRPTLHDKVVEKSQYY